MQVSRENRLNDRENAVSDITGIYIAHLMNYEDWNAEITLANWYDKAKPPVPRQVWDQLCRETKEHMKEREKKIQMWTRQTIDESNPN